MNFARNVEYTRKGVFDYILKSILFLLFHLTTDLLVLVFAVWSLN